jgi:site-specific recombinase XerD
MEDGRVTEDLYQLHQEGDIYDRRAKAVQTASLYRRLWAAFTRWCQEQDINPETVTPEQVALYVTVLARRLKPSSIAVHIAALAAHWAETGRTSPTENIAVRRRLAGIRRAKGTAPVRKAPLTLDDLDRVLENLGGGNGAKNRRDKALLMLGWAAGLRRSEVAGLDAAPGGSGSGYIRFTEQGLDVILVRGKTDQEGEGHIIAIPLRRGARHLCPVRLLRDWIDYADITGGPLFRPIDRMGRIAGTRLRPDSVARMVKDSVEAIGLDASLYSGHSLRAGFVTTTANAGASISAMQATTRHRQIGTLFSYVRQVRRYEESALNQVPSW